MPQGWITLHRKILENPLVCKDTEHFAVWVYLLLNATHQEYSVMFDGEKKKLIPGQLITGRKVISQVLGINESKVHRILNTYEGEQQIEQQTTPRGRLITIINWSKYQVIEQQIEQQVNNKTPEIEQQVNNKTPEIEQQIEQQNNPCKQQNTNIASSYTKKNEQQSEHPVNSSGIENRTTKPEKVNTNNNVFTTIQQLKDKDLLVATAAQSDEPPLESSESTAKKTRAEIQFPPESREYKIAEYLFQRIRENDPMTKVPKLSNWAQEIDRILRIDNRAERDLKIAIDYATTDSFWAANCLSAKSLRKHMQRLLLQAKQPEANSTSIEKKLQSLDQWLQQSEGGEDDQGRICDTHGGHIPRLPGS